MHAGSGGAEVGVGVCTDRGDRVGWGLPRGVKVGKEGE